VFLVLPRCSTSGRIVGGAWHDWGVHPPTRLDDSERGRWRVVTQTSTHFLDLNRRAADAGWSVSALRCDREFVESSKRVRCEVGAEMQLLLRIRGDRVTVRLTTEVVAITPADESSPRG